MISWFPSASCIVGTIAEVADQLTSGVARLQTMPGHCTPFFFLVSKGGVLTKVTGLESEVVHGIISTLPLMNMCFNQ